MFENLIGMKRITVAIDSFKGSLSSQEVANAFADGWKSFFSECDIRKVCIADGGEGTVDALVETLDGEYVEVVVSDPIGRPIKARYGIIEEGKTAVMEMSAASGLPLLTPEERNPLYTSTYGTGEMIADALRRGCRKILMGIGGSATNDGGLGMFRALGFKLLDNEGAELCGDGESLERLARIDGSEVMKELSDTEFVVACDVNNPLYGERGAAYVYAPQKGADAAMVERLDVGLRNYARVIESFNGALVADLQGAGAAGGLGAGFSAVLGARLERGIDMVLGAMHFHKIVEGSELVITGEGRLDRQTVMGKAPSGVLRVATNCGIPTIAIGGSVAWCEELAQSGFAAILPVVSGPISLEEAMRRDVAIENIRRTALQIAKLIDLTQK